MVSPGKRSTQRRYVSHYPKSPSSLRRQVTHSCTKQPWGYPSAPLQICSLPSGTLIAFLARHGAGHSINPSAVPSRANIAALKSLGVRAILAFSAVGSLREEIAPGDFALCEQIIDRTKGVRPASFFEGTSVVAHAMFGDPFSNRCVFSFFCFGLLEY